MKYLLDSRTLLWLLEQPEKLSKRARQIIEDPHCEVFVSTISFWELSLKHSLGKLSFEGLDLEDLEEIITDTLFIGVIGLNEQETLSFHRLPFLEAHRDPFDRMLAWQAIKRGMALISSDPTFAMYHSCGLRSIW